MLFLIIRIKSAVYSIIKSKLKTGVLVFSVPLFILVAFILLIVPSVANVFFLAIFLLCYYTVAFTLLLTLYKVIWPDSVRTPFYFIKRLNTTGNKEYWDEYQQPSRHLIGAEIGVYRGNNAEHILKFLNIKELVLVDPWKSYADVMTGTRLDDSFYESLFLEVDAKFAYNPKVHIVRDLSVNAAKLFEDDYFDFVYLDGDHSYEAVLSDLQAWYPKLKKFGVMCGDDFGHPSGVGVIEAVTKFTFNNQLLTQVGRDSQFWFVKI